jgi:hypothetical protein
VIKVFVKAIHAIVTIQTSGAKRERMRGHEPKIHLTVAGIARFQSERCDIAVMAIITLEWRTCSRLLVGV